MTADFYGPYAATVAELKQALGWAARWKWAAKEQRAETKRALAAVKQARLERDGFHRDLQRKRDELNVALSDICALRVENERLKHDTATSHRALQAAQTLETQATETAALVAILRDRVQELELQLARYKVKEVHGG